MLYSKKFPASFSCLEIPSHCGSHYHFAPCLTSLYICAVPFLHQCRVVYLIMKTKDVRLLNGSPSPHPHQSPLSPVCVFCVCVCFYLYSHLPLFGNHHLFLCIYGLFLFYFVNLFVIIFSYKITWYLPCSTWLTSLHIITSSSMVPQMSRLHPFEVMAK